MAKIKIEDLPILESLGDEEVKGITGGSERLWERQARLETEQRRQDAGRRRLQSRGLPPQISRTAKKGASRRRR